MDPPKASVNPAVAVEDNQTPAKEPVVSSKKGFAKPRSSVISGMLRIKNDPLQTVENSAKELVTDVRPGSSRSDTPDQENRLKQRVVKKEPLSRETSVVSLASSGKSDRNIGKPPPKKLAKKTPDWIKEEDDDDDEEVKPRRKVAKKKDIRSSGEYSRISDKWDEYREECTNMTRDDLKELTAHVYEVFLEVKKDYQKNIHTIAKAFYTDKVVTNFKRKEYKEFNGDESTPMITRTEKTCHFCSKDALPRMRYFTHVENNILVADRLRLTHIPYVEEDQDDFEWVNELRRHYTEGIHGADRGIDEYINEYLLFRLLCDLENNRKNHTMKDVNFTVFTMFPNKYSFRKLEHPEFLPRLKRRFGVGNQIAQVMNGCDAVGEKMCSRDGTFKCMHHINLLEVPLPKRAIKNVQKEDLSPCCEDCGYNSIFDGTVPADDVFSTLLNKALYDLIENLFVDTNILVCKATKLANRLLKRQGISPKTCAQYAQLAKKATVVVVKEVVQPTKKIPSERDRHKIFRNCFNKTIDNSKPFKPCNHEGECHLADSQCECFQNNSPCNAHCKCGPACRVLFPGCRCAPGQCRTDICPCFRARWECDPANCGKCRPSPTSADVKCCGNISIQQSFKKRIRVGVSEIAGYGCFLLEDASKGDLISEYTGEVISDCETERRGSIQDRMKLSYVFNLNNEQSIDAGRMGNLIRFANHSNNPNCEAKTMMVDGVQRIGIYAKMNIPSGKEIFFDYSYNSDQKELYVNVKHPSAKGGKSRVKKE